MSANKKRIWRSLFISLGLLILLSVFAVLLLWQQLRQQWDIQNLAIDGFALSISGVQIDQLQVELGAEAATTISLQNFNLSWHGLRLTQLQLKQLTISLSPSPPDDQQHNDTLLNLDPLQEWPSWLPERVEIEHITLNLPCLNGVCPIKGQLLWRQNSTPQLQASLSHQQHQLQLTARFEPQQLQLEVQENQQPLLKLSNIWQGASQHYLHQGAVNLELGSEQQWLLNWLNQWSATTSAINSRTPELKLNGQWIIEVPQGNISLSQLLQTNGRIALDANLPSPWPLPGVAQLQGNAQLQLISQQQRWQAQQINAQFTLSQLAPYWRQWLPESVELGDIQIDLNAPTLEPRQKSQAVQVAISSQGPSTFNATAELLLDSHQQDWQLSIEKLTANFNSPKLKFAGITLLGLQTQVIARGNITRAQQEMSLLAGSQLSASGLQWPEQTLKSGPISASLQGLTLAVGQDQPLSLSLPLQLSLQSLEHPQLKASQWQLNGQLELRDLQIEASARLSNDSGYSAPSKLNYSPETGLKLVLSRASWDFAKHNPLSASLSDWPELLELSSGDASLQADLTWHNECLNLNALLEINQASGIWDSSELSNLSTRLKAQIQNQQLKLQVEQLTLAQLNPGIPLQEIALNASFTGPLNQLEQGQLIWDQAQAKVFDGRLWLESGEVHLKQSNPSRLLQLEGLNLEKLLQNYPTEGLYGQGTIDGQLPLSLSANGFSISDGTISARAPGGRLVFNNAKLDALGQNNPAMAVVVQALEDFSYSRLDSGVGYTEQGKLNLALQLQGFSPALEKGRAINFNINLEEDIPALLRSLQLSGKVSDRIQQRMQQRMLPAPSAP